jgi:hypothetical protein
MNRRNLLVLVGGAFATPFALGAAAQACGPERAFQKPIRLAPGGHEAKVSHAIKSDLTHEWVLHGRAGQKVEITLDAKKSSFSLSPDLAVKGPPRWGNALKDGGSVRTWSGTLPKSGRMLIEVMTDAARDNYTLAIRQV